VFDPGPGTAARVAAGRRSRTPALGLAFALLGPLAVACLGLGRLWVPPARIVGILAARAAPSLAPAEPAWADFEEAVIMNVRLPRILMAMLVGSGLALAGGAFQGLFANPLATPDTLGVGAGASFGAALGILLSESFLVVQACSLGMGLVAMGLTYAVSKVKERRSVLMIVLSGIVTGAFFQALISLAKYVADPETKLPAITYWLLGSIADVSYASIAMGAPAIILGMAVIVALRWRLDILSLSDDEARSLGLNVPVLRWAVIGASTLITASAVSLCGQVGWVGLVVPHAARMIVGSDHRTMIPMSAALGAGFLLVVDTFARSATAAEIPLSILTAMIGAPFFAALLRKTQGGAWS